MATGGQPSDAALPQVNKLTTLDDESDGSLVKSNVRVRVPTEKGQIYQEDQATKNFRTSVSNWSRHVTNCQTQISDCRDANILREIRNNVETKGNAVIDSYLHYTNVMREPASEICERYENFEQQNLNVISNITDAIRCIENDKVSVRSRSSASKSVRSDASVKSKRSVRSSASKSVRSDASIKSQRVEAAAEAAALQVELKHFDAINEQKLKLEKARKIQTLEMTNARLATLEKYEDLQKSDQSPSPLQQHYTLNPNAPEFTQHSIVPDQSQLDKNTANTDLANITKLLAEQMNLSRLPTPEPGIFSGNPLKFPCWIAAFETLIESRGIPSEEKIHFLKRYLNGEALNCIQDCFLFPTNNTYEEAKLLLKRRYGDNFTIASAFRDKLENWPKIGNRDALNLRRFADFLRQCKAAMTSNPSLLILSDERENKKMLTKLPDWLTMRWARLVADSREKHHTFPSFAEFVDFIVKEADIACDPITCLQNKPESVKKETSPKAKSRMPSASSARAFQAYSRHKQTCIMCKKTHHLDFCKQFLDKPIAERKDFAKANKLCFACLNPGHVSKSCTYRRKCRTCSHFHPTAFHGDRPQQASNLGDTTPSPTPATPIPTSSTPATPIPTSSAPTTPSTGTPMPATTHATFRKEICKSTMIVPVWISHNSQPEHEILVYALLDNQSDTSFILDKTLAQLGIVGIPTNLSLSTMSVENQLIPCNRINNLIVRGYNGTESVTVRTLYSRNIMPADRSHIPTPATAKLFPHLNEISSSLMPLDTCDIGLLIGYDCPQALFPTRIIPPVGDGPFAQKTVLGWGIVGILDHDSVDSDTLGPSHEAFFTACTSAVTFRTKVKEILNPQDITKLLERDFLESDLSTIPMSQQDFRFLEIMDNNVARKQNGHYQMPLPFDKDSVNLPNNYNAAEARLQQLKRRFHREKEFSEQYCKSMTNMITKGYAELVPPDEQIPTEGSVWYLPHHGVYNSKKPGKLRVVFDCSANFKGHSLNAHLLQGPDLNNNLIGVLLRFRKENIAIICDIEAMFHQFIVHPIHRNYLRFLWWQNGNFDLMPDEYRMTVHLFGATSSPACANFALKKIANDYESKHGSEAAEFIRNNFYVDDGLISVATPEEGISLVKATQNLCAEGGLRLHKFASNSRDLLAAIDKKDRITETQSLDLSLDLLPAERALGVRWSMQSDSLHFQMTIKNRDVTRRNILSTVSSIFDPLGLIAPITLTGKLVLQELCRQKLDWDEKVPEALGQSYLSWLTDLNLLQELDVDRCYKPKDFGHVVKTELHNFSDASFDGYGQCSYLRLVDDSNKVHCCLVMGKARVAPLKSTTVPRLELTAALVSTRINTILVKELQYEGMQSFFWTDSKAVLGYIKNDDKKFHVFVANRVREIRDHSNPEDWYYVPSNLNPADAASRGLSTKELMESNWLTAPPFLWEYSIGLLSDENKSYTVDVEDSEVKSSLVLATTSSVPTILDTVQKFDSWNKMCRVVALCFRFCKILKDHTQSEAICVEDMNLAELAIVRLVQRETFKEEIELLERRKPLKKTSKLFNLDPFLQDGIIRVGGRIRHASVPFHEKHPVVLPKDHLVSVNVVRHYHERLAHQGKNMTINEVRSNGYWIIGINKTVSRIISKCVTCRKLRGRLQDQKMADLPEDRVTPCPPFTHCGVDYFGPWLVKEGRKELKRYGVLFTCLSSRAVHIETANSLDSSSFINALRRFISIRGPIRTLRSDRGTNFVGGQRELEEALQEMDNDKIRQFLLSEKCDFVFNPPSASHMGGVWERQIRSIRNVMTSLLNNVGQRMDDEMFRTFMCEAAAIVNSRPLTVDTLNDATATLPISPNNILTMKSEVILPPPGNFNNEYCRSRWRRVQYLLDQFWIRWRREYLQTLQRRQKWTHQRRDTQVGDIVLIKDEVMPRAYWKLARVVEVFPSKDGHVRTVRLLVGDRYIDDKGRRVHTITHLVRPVHKIVLVLENESHE